MEVKFAKLRDNAVIPFKKHLNDVGYDLVYAPEEPDPLGHVIIGPGGKHRFKTGIKALFPPGFVMEIKNRSGLSFNDSVLVSGGIIDPDYRGEIMVALHNTTNDHFAYIKEGDKIAQAMFFKIEHLQIEEISIEDYEKEQTERASNGYGSTGK
jgi:dUTP pyrophosphatase